MVAIEKRRPCRKPAKAECTGGHAILGVAHELLSQQGLRGTRSGGNCRSVRSRLSTLSVRSDAGFRDVRVRLVDMGLGEVGTQGNERGKGLRARRTLEGL